MIRVRHRAAAAAKFFFRIPRINPSVAEGGLDGAWFQGLMEGQHHCRKESVLCNVSFQRFGRHQTIAVHAQFVLEKGKYHIIKRLDELTRAGREEHKGHLIVCCGSEELSGGV